MNSVYTIVSGGPPYQVGPYAGPGRGVFYKLRVARSDVVSLSLSRQYAASESAKKAVARGSCFVARKSSPSFRMGCGQISQRAALWDGPYKPQTHSPRATNYEQQKKHYPSSTYPAESRISLFGCILSHHQVTRFGISDSHGFARRKAPLLTMHYVYITFQAGRPSGRPLRATSHESRTTKKH